MSDTYHFAGNRFGAVYPYETLKEVQVEIVGVGGLGSWLAEILTRLGFDNLVLWDHDVVGLENLGGQNYNSSELNFHKPYALATRLLVESNRVPHIHTNYKLHQYSSFNSNTQVVVVAVDSIRARRLVLSKFKALVAQGHKRRYLYIDGRTGWEVFEVYACPQGNIHLPTDLAGDLVAPPGVLRNYAKTFNVREVGNRGCGQDSTPHCSIMCASVMAATVAEWAVGLAVHSRVFFNLGARTMNKGHIIYGRSPRSQQQRQVTSLHDASDPNTAGSSSNDAMPSLPHGEEHSKSVDERRADTSSIDNMPDM